MTFLKVTVIITVCLYVVILECNARREWHDSFYDYSVRNIDGKRVRLEKYRGTPSLVVNVASECGYTDMAYRELVRLSQRTEFEGRLNILAFPCNQFGYQEPHSDRDIKRHVQTMYDVEFPLFSKVDVIGHQADPAWQYLTSNSQEPDWNFWKYLVDRDGHVKNAWGPNVPIDSFYSEIQQETIMAIPNYRYHYDRYDDEF